MTKQMDTNQPSIKTAWLELINALKNAGDLVTGPSGAIEEIDIVEGYRQILRLLSFASDFFLEYEDRQRPDFFRVSSPTRKQFGDNPDVFYDSAKIDGSKTYRLHGNRGTVEYLAFCVYRRSRNNRILANLSDRDFEIRADGSFEIILSPDKHSGNWIQLDSKTDEVIARQYFLDQKAEIPATYQIEQITPPSRPEPLSEAFLAKSITDMSRFLPNAVARTVSFVAEIKKNTNRFLNSEEIANVDVFSPTPDNKYTMTWYEIKEDEALIIEVRPPQTRYWSLMPFNFWFESLDYRNHQVIINSSQALLEPDGTFRAVLANRDPGTPNWLDTAGHLSGMLCFRWLQSEDSPIPTCRLVPLQEVSPKK
jgi:hypothetical protein